ncbi:2-amino-4-hydroxy-6-hydroxymethyldihydropteridine diphosphokinase [Paenibacillus yanchengensis]|uniref:2-amino-4-hydroxy-6-hydroxymethyldihydropteridine diphosphokinase n=1 Tax=Paenibacillus yanchengensis TaxID=2035833 RepID=A0ABW4YIK2_9BACL
MTDASSVHQVYIALGSNMGERERQLMEAIHSIHQWENTNVIRISDIYETDPVGYMDQPQFLNMVIYVQTEMSPLVLLHRLLQLELQMGRERGEQSERFGPRTIDLDILLYDNVITDEQQLTLPHPRMMERAFVLIPLYAIMAHPHELYQQVSVLTAAAQRSGKEGVKLWKTTNWHKELELLEN